MINTILKIKYIMHYLNYPLIISSHAFYQIEQHLLDLDTQISKLNAEIKLLSARSSDKMMKGVKDDVQKNEEQVCYFNNIYYNKFVFILQNSSIKQINDCNKNRKK